MISLNAITSALLEKNINNWTGLQMLARHAPEATSQLFQLAAKDQDVLTAIGTEALYREKLIIIGLVYICSHDIYQRQTVSSSN